MITEYHGYESYNENISQTMQYDAEKELSENNDKHNQHNETYEQVLNLPHYDALTEITNKIRISDALSKNFINQQSQLNKSGRIRQYQPVIQKGIDKSKIIGTAQLLTKNYNVILMQKKSKSRSLIYYQENKKINQTPRSKNSTQKLKPSKADLPLQIKKVGKNRQETSPQKYYLPITQINNSSQYQKPRYFAKNQQNTINTINTKRQVLLTSRSGYNLSISGVFLQNITKHYQQNITNKENEITLKKKIQLKLTQDKTKRIKTESRDCNNSHHHKKSGSKLYKPLDPYEVPHTRVILSTEPFENRQQKTLQNKKNKVEQLKEKKLEEQIKECTFKPRTNISKIRKPLNR